MLLGDYFDDAVIQLHLSGETPSRVRTELVGLLRLPEPATRKIEDLLDRREALGSTGIGRGIAIPHCRTLAVPRLLLAFGRHVAGVDYAAIDGRPVHHFFLIVAPPMEVSNQYLPLLGRIAQLAKEPDVPRRLSDLATSRDFIGLLKEKRV